jgi:dTDP-4-amino-4,6-dideoxygalactose transaminase
MVSRHDDENRTGPPMTVPFNKPTVTGFELDYIREAIEQRSLSGDGIFTKRCNDWLEQRLGCERALLTHSCTAALEMAAILCGIGPGDEVIMPSFTFVSTANAVVLRGATPVFVDVDPLSFNIDPAAVDAAVTPQTRAVFVVHYAGVPCDMDAIIAVAGRHNLLVVEDAAQALGSTYKGRPAAALGDLGAISFHESKNLGSGEGGALTINRADLITRAEIIREKGTNRTQLIRGQVDKYTWLDVGSSFLPSDLLAAFLLAQFERLDEITTDRRRSWDRYHEALAPLEAKGLLRRPVVPGDCEHNAHIYAVMVGKQTPRDTFIGALRAAGVNPTFHYVPLHSSPGGRRFGRAAGSMAVTDDIAERLVRLPLHHGMATDVETVIQAVEAAFRR